MKVTISELQQLLKVIEDHDLSIPSIISLINTNIGENKPIETFDAIKLNVDYTKSLERAIADGHYDWKNNDITVDHFPTSPEMIGKKVDIVGKLFHFDYYISSKDIIKKMSKEGFRPATLMELLALGATYPELQRQFSIIALSSIWFDSNDNRRVPCLSIYACSCRLNLSYSDSGSCRFFGIHE